MNTRTHLQDDINLDTEASSRACSATYKQWKEIKTFWVLTHQQNGDTNRPSISLPWEFSAEHLWTHGTRPLRSQAALTTMALATTQLIALSQPEATLFCQHQL